MFYRLLFSFLLILLTCISCKRKITSDGNNLQELDTIVDFSKVDVSPYFKVCEKLLEKAKTECFRSNIQKYFTTELEKLELSSKENINENIVVILLVDKNGDLVLKKLNVSDKLISIFPNFEESIKQITLGLPKLYPALKRGIPVKTEYNLPISINVE